MYLTSTCQIKTDSGKSDRLILVIDENQCYLKGRIHGYAHVRASINQTTILRFLSNLSAKKPLSNVLYDSN